MSYAPRTLAAHGDMFTCGNHACPSAAKCWRHEKPAHIFRQTYISPIPEPGEDRCDDFIGIRETVDG